MILVISLTYWPHLAFSKHFTQEEAVEPRCYNQLSIHRAVWYIPQRLIRHNIMDVRVPPPPLQLLDALLAHNVLAIAAAQRSFKPRGSAAAVVAVVDDALRAYEAVAGRHLVLVFGIGGGERGVVDDGRWAVIAG